MRTITRTTPAPRPTRRPAPPGPAASRLAGRSRLTAIPRPPGTEERKVDFVALTAMRLRATKEEVAAGRAAGRAMRAKLDALRAGRSAPPTSRPSRAAGLLPFPADDLPADRLPADRAIERPTPARPADARPARRYTRGAAA